MIELILSYIFILLFIFVCVFDLVLCFVSMGGEDV